MVDPELRGAFLDHPQVVDAATLPQVRARMATPQMGQGDLPVARFVAIPGGRGRRDVPVAVINATPGRSRPAILYLHGGGFVAGSAAGELDLPRTIAHEHGAVVVSVDYRLAPEAPFPAALDDNYAALTWLHRNAASLGVDRTRIAVMGTSAGGGHAAMLTALTVDRGEVHICFQLLISPMLDDRTGSSRAAPPDVGTFIWTADANRFGWTALLGQPAGLSGVPGGAVPARRTDFAGFPPTYIGVGGIDLFAGEDIDYAARLATAGVPVELVVVPGAYHVFFAIRPEAQISKQFVRSYNTALARAFAKDRA